MAVVSQEEQAEIEAAALAEGAAENEAAVEKTAEGKE
jgi:hypothetical protein